MSNEVTTVAFPAIAGESAPALHPAADRGPFLVTRRPSRRPHPGDELLRDGVAVAASTAALTLIVLASLLHGASLGRCAGSWLVPIAKPGYFPGWLAGPLGPVTNWFPMSTGTLETVFTVAVVTMLVAYIVVIVARPLGCVPPGSSPRSSSCTSVGLLSPPLSLSDVFNYLNYGRMEAVQG